MNSYELRVKGKVVEAPPKELELLNCLASHPNRVYTCLLYTSDESGRICLQRL